MMSKYVPRVILPPTALSGLTAKLVTTQLSGIPVEISVNPDTFDPETMSPLFSGY